MTKLNENISTTLPIIINTAVLVELNTLPKHLFLINLKMTHFKTRDATAYKNTCRQSINWAQIAAGPESIEGESNSFSC